MSSDDSEHEEDEESYEVEEVKKWRYNMKLKRKEFYIKWCGYPEDQNTWEPEEHLNCDGMIKKFRKTLTADELRYLDSDNPDSLTGLQRNAEIIEMTGRYEKGRPSTSSSSTNTDGRAVIFITFDDEDGISERVDLEELRLFRPDKAFEFVEKRLIDIRKVE